MMHTTALVGCAHIHTPGFVKRLNERSDVQVKYVWDHDPDRAEKRAAELGAARVAELSDIWSDADIGSVVICSETRLHEDLVKYTAAAKKHLFVEKPLGMAGKDAYAMARAIDDAGVLFQTGYFMRGNPIHLFLREQIQKGSFGKITRLRHTNYHSGSLGDWFTPEWLWMTDLEQAGVGAFGDLGTHSLDIMMWLLGDVTSVTATLATVTGRYGDLDETGEALMRFKNGVIGSLGGGWVDVAHPVGLILSGTEGHAYVANRDQLYFKSQHVEGADGETPWTALPEAWPHAFELFFDAVNGKPGVSLVSPQEAAVRSAVMEAMYQAANTHTWVQPALE
jgi:predicted dehydrogenase